MPIQTGYIVLSDVSDGNNGESVFLAYADNVVVGTGEYPSSGGIAIEGLGSFQIETGSTENRWTSAEGTLLGQSAGWSYTPASGDSGFEANTRGQLVNNTGSTVNLANARLDIDVTILEVTDDVTSVSLTGVAPGSSTSFNQSNGFTFAEQTVNRANVPASITFTDTTIGSLNTIDNGDVLSFSVNEFQTEDAPYTIRIDAIRLSFTQTELVALQAGETTITGFSQSPTDTSRFIGTFTGISRPTDNTEYMWSRYTGNDGDSSRTVYLFQNGITAPAAPLSTEGFNTDGEAVNVGTWSTAATAPPAGQTIYVASLGLRRPNSTGDWVIDGTWQVNPASTSGTNGNPGQSVREVTIFRLNDSTINASSGTFADPLASNSEWSFNVPEITVNGQVVYSRTRTFTSDGAAPQDTSWSGQSIAFRRVDGQTVTGPRGQGVRDATIFRLNSTTISSSSGTYTDPLNGNTSWSFSVPAISANGDIIYSSTRTLTSDAASPQDGTWSTPTIAFRRVDGQTVTGPPGTPAPRFSERLLYTNPAVSTANARPSAPSATITWSTGALSSITSGWSETRLNAIVGVDHVPSCGEAASEVNVLVEL